MDAAIAVFGIFLKKIVHSIGQLLIKGAEILLHPKVDAAKPLGD